MKSGALEVGEWADITVLDKDVLNVGAKTPSNLLDGKALMTTLAGNVVFTQ